MTSSTFSLVSSSRRLTARDGAYWSLRVGAALCFIGHGAFGFITKAAWLPYFGVAGIPEGYAWKLMPMVGAVDVLAAMAVLFAPRALPLVYMSVWAAWTALLRPLAGESVWEMVERAGNYGVPMALLVMTGLPRSIGSLFHPRLSADADEQTLARVRTILRWTTAALLFGHGALGAFTTGPVSVAQYGAIGLDASAVIASGWIEILMATAVAFRPGIPLLIGVAAWKLATESLWIVTGTPIWEFLERAGSYAAPLALALLLHRRALEAERRSILP
jgi:hypothetical protein